MFRNQTYWLTVPIILWPVTLAFAFAVGVSAANLVIYRRASAKQKNLTLHIAIYAGATVIVCLSLFTLIIAGMGCC